jgi:hypothetical protein
MPVFICMTPDMCKCTLLNKHRKTRYSETTSTTVIQKGDLNAQHKATNLFATTALIPTSVELVSRP